MVEILKVEIGQNWMDSHRLKFNPIKVNTRRKTIECDEMHDGNSGQ